MKKKTKWSKHDRQLTPDSLKTTPSLLKTYALYDKVFVDEQMSGSQSMRFIDSPRL